MSYSRLLQDAWSMTWRHRFLWILGLFAGSSAGSCSGPNLNFNFPGQWTTGRDDYEGPSVDTIVNWFADNLVLLIAAVTLLVLLSLIFMAISLVAQGGMAQATADLAGGRPSSLASALSAGLRLFWRFLGLWLIMTAVTIVIAMGVAALAVAGFALFSAIGDAARVALVVLGVMLGLLAVVVGIPLSILFGIIVVFAQRAIVVEDVGPLAALQSGAALLRARLGPSLLVWLISVGVGLAAGIAMLIVTFAVAVPLFLLGAIIALVAGFDALTIVYIVIAALVVVAVIWGLSAIVNTYFWSYWTLAYLRLREQPERQA